MSQWDTFCPAYQVTGDDGQAGQVLVITEAELSIAAGPGFVVGANFQLAVSSGGGSHTSILTTAEQVTSNQAGNASAMFTFPTGIRIKSGSDVCFCAFNELGGLCFDPAREAYG